MPKRTKLKSRSKSNDSNKRKSRSKSNDSNKRKSRSPTPVQPQQSTMTDMLVNELQLAFPELTIQVFRQQFDEIYKLQFDYIHGTTCSDKTVCECFALRVYDAPETIVHIDRIKYKYGPECGLSGTSILSRLTNMFKMHRTPGVQIYDSASIHTLVNGEPRDIKLSVYLILLNGESWYNRYGYRSDNYATEVEQNNAFSNKPLTPQLLRSINNGLSGIHEFSKGTTFRECVQKINETLRDRTSPEEQRVAFTLAYFKIEDYVTKNKKIKYDYSGLKLQYE